MGYINKMKWLKDNQIIYSREKEARYKSNKESYLRWVENSTKPHSDDYIIDILIRKPDDISISLLCNFVELSPDLIDKIYLVTAGLFRGSEYNKEQLELLVDLRWHFDTDAKAVAAIQKIIHFRQSVCIRKEDIINHTDYFEDKEMLMYATLPLSLLLQMRKILEGNDSEERIDWKVVAGYENLPKAFRKRYEKKLTLPIDKQPFKGLYNRGGSRE